MSNDQSNTQPAILEEPETPSAAAILEQQITKTMPAMPADLRRVVAQLGASIAKKSATQAKPETPPEPPPEPPAKVIQLDFWEDSRRAAPNIVFRSKLFPALNPKQERRYLDKEQIFTTKGSEIYFTGKQFDQSDLDVYLEILNFARPFPLGIPVRFTAYSMLKALGRNTGKSDREWLHGVLTRLRGGTVDMTDHKKRYFGGLIEGGVCDEITTHYEIIINPRFAVLFGFGMWSALDKAQRNELGRNQTAKALHAYYSTHAAPGPHEYATLAEITGLTDKNPRKVKMRIIAAHEELKRVGFLSDYKAGATTIKVTINHTPGQTHHIVKKIIKSRKKKGTRQREG